MSPLIGSLSRIWAGILINVPAALEELPRFVGRRTFDVRFDGVIRPLGAINLYKPIFQKDTSRLLEFGKKMLVGISVACSTTHRLAYRRLGRPGEELRVRSSCEIR